MEVSIQLRSALGAPAAGGSGARNRAARALRALERAFDHPFGAAANPLRQLGALAFWFFWIVAVSGVYLYIFFDTSVSGAYASVESLTRDQWYAGGVMRSLHRYASDAFLVVTVLHLLRELAYGRFTGFRWFSWVSGVPTLVFMLASGIVGYWLVWDAVAQFVGVGVTEWVGWLPGFGPELVRNFIATEAMTDRFFSLLVFIHLGVPLFLLAAMWIHIQRISRPRTQPAGALAWGSLAALVVLSLAHPAVSDAPADLARVPTAVTLDWFYLFPLPAMYATSAGAVWAAFGAGIALLCALPWLVRAPRAPVARVSPANCNGCSRCFADCPYAAVLMREHPDGRPGKKIAVVLEDLCAGCGICAGACPSSTPFRTGETLVTGIDMPQLPVDAMRARLERALAAGKTMIVFGCESGAPVEALRGPDVAAWRFPCIAQVPPSFVDYALRTGARGVLIARCPEHDCEFRLGSRWAAERLAGTREPHLRPSVPRERVRIIEAAPEDAEALAHAAADFAAEMARLGPAASRGRVKRRAPASEEVNG
jgi:coenzyme F420-reducing hydrogenase delta subunit/quinol-cytochrome oxidoreductase complex cytochrome b subunit/NAD-dependent dihydropyrimidine dehydrogenase PreA subunit